MHTCEISVLDFKILNMFSKVKGKNNVCFQYRLMQNMTNLLDHHTLRIYLVNIKNGTQVYRDWCTKYKLYILEETVQV